MKTAGFVPTGPTNAGVARRSYRRAGAIAPEDARYAYVYALALNTTGTPSDALLVLEHAYQAHPADFDILSALATISRDSGERKAAIDYARRLTQVAPNSRDARALLNSLISPQ